MPIYEIKLPKAVATWLLEVKKVQPSTYLENQIGKRILKEYEEELTAIKVTAANVEAKKEVATAKQNIAVTEKLK